MSIVIDAIQAPDSAALRAAGVSGLCRYLSWPHRWGGQEHATVNPKIIQRAECDRLRRDGFDVLLNWEYDDRDWLGNDAAGKAHAAEAARQARALAYPTGCAIVGSADFDMTRDQWEAAGRGYAYAFAGNLRAAGYAAGVYGPYDVLTWCAQLGVFDVYWQAGMSTAWSGGRNRNAWPGAHLRQRRHVWIGGIDCDANDVLQANYGQWTAGATPTQGDDMPLDPLEHAQVNNSERYLQSIFSLTDKALGISDTQTARDLPSPFVAAFRQLVADVAALRQVAGADEARDRAAAAAITALTTGGTSVDTKVVLDAIAAVRAELGAAIADERAARIVAEQRAERLAAVLAKAGQTLSAADDAPAPAGG